jgi:phosphohistidine phosphatase
MNLFILRHASAGTRRPNPTVDVKRQLDKDGKRQCIQLGHVLNALSVNFDLIVSSPLKRSLQTAQLVGTETGYETPILISEALRPDATFQQFQRLLHECSAYENVMVVGHNPNITTFLVQLLSASNGSDRPRDQPRNQPRIRLRKGSIARLNMQRSAVLQWLLDPRVIRELYATSIKSSRRKTSRK